MSALFNDPITVTATYLVDCMENSSLTSPVLNRWPSVVQRLTPHLAGSPRANCGM